jgi:hypothetical protein
LSRFKVFEDVQFEEKGLLLNGEKATRIIIDKENMRPFLESNKPATKESQSSHNRRPLENITPFVVSGAVGVAREVKKKKKTKFDAERKGNASKKVGGVLASLSKPRQQAFESVRSTTMSMR